MAETDEQKAREDMRKSLEWNLTHTPYLEIIGLNALEKDPYLFGTIGHSSGEGRYDEIMGGEGAKGLRKKIYDEELETRERLGIAERPAYPTNYEVTKTAISLVNEAVMGLPLGSLEKAIGKVAKGVDLQIPDPLKDYVGMEPELDEETRKTVFTYKQLSMEAIRRGSAFMVMDSQKYADINSTAEALNKKYEKDSGKKN